MLVVLLVASVGKVVAPAWGVAERHAVPRCTGVGVGLNARGAMEVMLASVALEVGLIDQRVFVALIVMRIVTSLLSGLMMQRLWAPVGVASVRDDRS